MIFWKIILPEIQFAIASAKGCLRNGDYYEEHLEDIYQ